MFVESVASKCGVNKAVSGLPASQSADLAPERKKEPVFEVWAAIGRLIWVHGMTRPDIINAVRTVAHQARDYAGSHWRAVYKTMSYVNKTTQLRLMFWKGGGLKLSFYVDADYADKTKDRRSVSRVALMLGGTAVFASMTTQHCVILQGRTLPTIG